MSTKNQMEIASAFAVSLARKMLGYAIKIESPARLLGSGYAQLEVKDTDRTVFEVFKQVMRYCVQHNPQAKVVVDIPIVLGGFTTLTTRFAENQFVLIKVEHDTLGVASRVAFDFRALPKTSDDYLDTAFEAVFEELSSRTIRLDIKSLAITNTQVQKLFEDNHYLFCCYFQ